jgi:thiopurine S-methyltransferase
VDADFWHHRWQENLIAFHKGHAHAALPRYFDRLNVSAGAEIFVPLCGKSHDMAWMRERGYRVLGVELSPIAVVDFFSEQGIEYTKRKEGAFTVHEGDGVRLLCGDFFQLDLSHLEETAAVYDRAALIALPGELRERYARHLLTLLPARVPLLLLTLEYDVEEMNGPPFSVGEAEVRGHFDAWRVVEHLESREIIDEEPHLAERGLTHLTEHAFLLSGT